MPLTASRNTRHLEHSGTRCQPTRLQYSRYRSSRTRMRSSNSARTISAVSRTTSRRGSRRSGAPQEGDVRHQVARVDRVADERGRARSHDAAVGRHEPEAAAEHHLAGDDQARPAAESAAVARSGSNAPAPAARPAAAPTTEIARHDGARPAVRSTAVARRRTTVSTTTSASLTSSSSPVRCPVCANSPSMSIDSEQTNSTPTSTRETQIRRRVRERLGAHVSGRLLLRRRILPFAGRRATGAGASGSSGSALRRRNTRGTRRRAAPA